MSARVPESAGGGWHQVALPKLVSRQEFLISVLTHRLVHAIGWEISDIPEE